jgi:hypothetical protein
LSAYAGQTIQLQFRAETDGWFNSNFFIDDVVFGQGYFVCLPLATKNYCPYPGYFDDFSNPSSGWASGDTSRWTYGYLNEEYQILIKGTNDVYWITPDLVLPGSYVLEVDARQAWQGQGDYGLMFGNRYDSNGLIEAYRFLVDPYNQTYYVGKYKNGTWQTIIKWTYDARINSGTANHLSVRRVGVSIAVGVNGQWINTASDSDYTSSGRDAGLWVTSYDSAPLDVRFDNFRVSCPD